MASWVRFSAVHMVGGLVAIGLAVLFGNLLSFLIALAAGAYLGWWVTIRAGGLPLFVALIALFGGFYATSLEPALAENLHMAFGRLMAYTYLFGSVGGAAAGSMKREIDRQRRNRAAS